MKKYISPLVFGLCFLIVWQLVLSMLNTPMYLTPKPTDIANVFVRSFDYIIYSGMMTFSEAMSGYALAIVAGLSVGVAFARYRRIKDTFYHYTIIFQTLPAIAIAPLLILWMGNGMAMKIVLALIFSIFPIILSTYKGFSSTPFHFIDMFRLFGAKEKAVWTKLRFKFALPYIFQGLKLGLAFSFIGAIAGEFVGANDGIGSVILISSYRLDTSLIFASIAFLVFMVLCLFLILEKIEKKVLFWHEGFGREYPNESCEQVKVVNRCLNGTR